MFCVNIIEPGNKCLHFNFIFFSSIVSPATHTSSSHPPELCGACMCFVCLLFWLCISICGYAVLGLFSLHVHVFYDLFASFSFFNELRDRTLISMLCTEHTVRSLATELMPLLSRLPHFGMKLRLCRGPATIYFTLEMNFHEFNF